MEQSAPPPAEPSEAELAAALIAEGRALAEQCGAYVARLSQCNTLVKVRLEDGAVLPSVHLDQGWVNLGSTHLRLGLMCLKRAVEQPAGF